MTKDPNRPPNRDPKTNLFIPGGGNGGTTRKGVSVSRKAARTALQADLIMALQQHFREEGHKAIEIAYREDPINYLKIIVAVLPREFIVEDGRLESMGDDELAEHLEHIRAIRSGSDRSHVAGGDAAAPDRKQIEILPPIPKTKIIP